MLDHVGQGFRDEEVGGELDGVGQPISNRSFHLDRAAASCARAPRLPPRAPPRGGGSDESRGRARAARRSPPRPRPVRVTARPSWLASPSGSREPERERERDEPLLGSVVEVALEASPLGIGGGNEPGARCPHLGELRAHLGRETLVLEHEPGRRPHGLHERRLVEQRRIVNERSDLFAPRGHERDCPVRALRQLERPARSVDVAAVVEPIRKVERRVAECAGEALAQAGRPSASGARRRGRTPPVGAAATRRSLRRPRAGRAARPPGRSSRASGRRRRSRLTQASQSRAAGTVKAAAASSGACARCAGPRRTSRRRTSRTSSTPGRRPSRGSPVLGRRRLPAVCCGVTESTSRASGSTKRADELAADGCRIGAGDCEPARHATRDAPRETSAPTGRGAPPTARRAGSRAVHKTCELAH